MRQTPPAVLVLLVLLVSAPTAVAAAPACVVAGPLPPAKPATSLRFGITTQAAGSAGVVQEVPAPVVPAKAAAALNGLKLPGRGLVVRLNRMFESDGATGIRRFERLADGYIRKGFQVELQVRYHPSAAENGNIAAWVGYVREAVRAFAPRRGVVALSVTNEPNLALSPNTSDGYYQNVPQAVVAGIVAARREADRLGRADLKIGFTYAYRFTQDEQFFTTLGQLGGAPFLGALDYVGLQAYPGTVYPPPGVAAPAQAMVDAANLMRTCLFPRAGIGGRTKIWVTENGYPSASGQDPAVQEQALASTVNALHAVSGTLGITDYRYFNLRDNRSTGSDLFDAVGLLYDDYTPKAAYGAYRGLIARYGTPVRGRVCRVLRVLVLPRLRAGEHVQRFRVRVTNGRVLDQRLVRRRRGLRLRIGGRRPGRRTVIGVSFRSSRGRHIVLLRRFAPCA